MATLAQVRTRVDDWLAARWPTVQARQEVYLAAHGHYWQGKRTATLAPDHKTAAFEDAKADPLTDKPTDQSETWKDFLPEIDDLAIPCVFTVDVYSSPKGDGYVATVTAAYNGIVYSRSHNVGPESERTVAWHVVAADEPQAAGK